MWWLPAIAFPDRFAAAVTQFASFSEADMALLRSLVFMRGFQVCQVRPGSSGGLLQAAESGQAMTHVTDLSAVHSLQDAKEMAEKTLFVPSTLYGLCAQG